MFHACTRRPDPNQTTRHLLRATQEKDLSNLSELTVLYTHWFYLLYIITIRFDFSVQIENRGFYLTIKYSLH
jgi:hypothetical protein